MKQRISVRHHQSGPKQNLIRLTKRHIASGRGEKHQENVNLGVTVKLVSNLERIFPGHHPIQKELPLTEDHATAQTAEKT